MENFYSSHAIFRTIFLTMQVGIRTDTWEGTCDIPVRIYSSHGK